MKSTEFTNSVLTSMNGNGMVPGGDARWAMNPDIVAAGPSHTNVNTTQNVEVVTDGSVPKPTPRLTYKTASELLVHLESLRREKPSVDMSPLSKDLEGLLGELFGKTDGCDYSSFGSIVDRAKASLDESLPLGQYERSSLAIYLLVTAATAMKTWMDLKGFNTDLRDLEVATNPEFVQVTFGDVGYNDVDECLVAHLPSAGGVKPSVDVDLKVMVVTEEASEPSRCISVTQVRQRTCDAGMRIQRSRLEVSPGESGCKFASPKITHLGLRFLDIKPTDVVVKLNPFDGLSSEDLAAAKAFVNHWDNAAWFVEPGMGIVMNKDEWYICSDSGGSYAKEGFETSTSAKEWWQISENVDGYKVEIVEYDSVTHTFSKMVGANIVLGRDMYDFWRFNDLEMLRSAMYMYDQGEKSEAIKEDKEVRLQNLSAGIDSLLKSLNITKNVDAVGKNITVQEIINFVQLSMESCSPTKQEGVIA